MAGKQIEPLYGTKIGPCRSVKYVYICQHALVQHACQPLVSTPTRYTAGQVSTRAAALAAALSHFACMSWITARASMPRYALAYCSAWLYALQHAMCYKAGSSKPLNYVCHPRHEMRHATICYTLLHISPQVKRHEVHPCHGLGFGVWGVLAHAMLLAVLAPAMLVLSVLRMEVSETCA
eukprot:364261-Chlamydomonas_euryale.AAC.12